MRIGSFIENSSEIKNAEKMATQNDKTEAFLVCDRAISIGEGLTAAPNVAGDKICSLVGTVWRCQIYPCRILRGKEK